MPNLTIIAHIHAHPDHIEQVRTALTALIAPTHAEDGCILYDLHSDNTDPAHFCFYETWASRDHWQAHMQTPHLLAHQIATKTTVLKVTVHEMTRID